jgi:hypothetical protein
MPCKTSESFDPQRDSLSSPSRTGGLLQVARTVLRIPLGGLALSFSLIRDGMLVLGTGLAAFFALFFALRWRSFI